MDKAVLWFNRDEPSKDIYRELYEYARNKSHNWSISDYNRFYEATKDDRNILITKLEEMFKIRWLEEPTERPQITIKKGTSMDDIYRRVIVKHKNFRDRDYVKRKLDNALKSKKEKEIDTIEKYFDVRWV